MTHEFVIEQCVQVTDIDFGNFFQIDPFVINFSRFQIMN